VLHTGAHPDDEDSALIARLARGDGARVAYLSLNRGEGGQNRTGPELFDALGVIRTEELLQARRLDGGEQFFARAFDFGFTKTRAEAAQRWHERELLADMVRVIRAYRPLVVVSRWTGTPADDHGQHQYAGYLTPLAVSAAADPEQFPEQLAADLNPWTVRKFYVSVLSEGNDKAEKGAPVVEINTGQFDPLLGRSYFELAMEGRSQHKSQGEGALELRGARTSRLRLVARAPDKLQHDPHERSVFDGLDTTVRGIARLTQLRSDELNNELADIERDAALAAEHFNALDPRTVLSALNAGLAHTRQARARINQLAGQEDERREADFLLAQKEREFTEALRLATGARVDALADAETVVAGDTFNVAVRAFVPEELRGRVGALSLRAPAGWRVEETSAPDPKTDASRAAALGTGRETPQRVAYFRVTVPADAPPTQPYWLARPRQGDMYEWTSDDPQTLPFAPPLLTGEATIDAGASFNITRPVEYRVLDAVRGEVRRDVNVVPPVTVQLDPALVIVPAGARARTQTLTVGVTNNVPRSRKSSTYPDTPAVLARADVRAPAGWRVAQPAEAFALRDAGARSTRRVSFAVPPALKQGTYRLAVEVNAKDAEGLLPAQTDGSSQHTISYPHVQTHRFYTPAETTVRVFDLKVAPVRVAYVMGSGDEVPQAIERMGLKVTLLSEQDLATGDLARFDTIVIGVRASQARPDFVANRERLLEFVRRGGALIVQYQRPDYARQNLPPFPAAQEVPPPAGQPGGPTIARVVDETAPVTVLQPDHPAFNFPNKITEADWRGWVQERNLYNFTTFDARYTPLLEAHDAGEPANTGGEVYARIGRGHYVYTSYAWFRQLPAGVPGAYRLFANLLSLPKAPAR
jgi:LmbE family N-acetylglucosaminyl deacetylase